MWHLDTLKPTLAFISISIDEIPTNNRLQVSVTKGEYNIFTLSHGADVPKSTVMNIQPACQNFDEALKHTLQEMSFSQVPETIFIGGEQLYVKSPYTPWKKIGQSYQGLVDQNAIFSLAMEIKKIESRTWLCLIY